ncbi:hypothetical protein [Entomomonas asaccharolytica]|uniref:Terminase small subunit n=1 Tax=Entomomonas asaccharolytica TaxID=2785331 RepID=A0A974NEP7_9GAMM|nr:hypothetical protein [Entomomonas asaccharolytica]QQP85022.1 hypothetical protein JHT90_11580 [Entomomonas asaccharolytica]
MAKYNWQAIEKDYRLGQLSVRAIAEKYKMPNHSVIVRRANKYGWLRDHSKEINNLTQVGLLTLQEEKAPKKAPKSTTPTREDIEAAALTNIQVIKHHRNDIRTGRELVNLFMGQLQEAATNRNEIEAAILSETEEDQTIARRSAMLKAVALPTHASTLRDLSTTLKNLIPLERQAYNITDEVEGESYEERLARLASEAKDV